MGVGVWGGVLDWGRCLGRCVRRGSVFVEVG